MKATFDDSEYGLQISIEPETVKETGMLLRFAKNANSEKPNVYLTFKENIFCNIWLNKRKPSVQNNIISPSTK
jgi:hypothetical protein